MAKVHAPTGSALSSAIADVLQTKEEIPSTKELQKELLEEHQGWKVPERRVKKFLKRHLNKHSDPAGADDDASLATTASLKPGKKLLKMFGKKKKKKTVPILPEAAPVEAEKAPEPEPKKEEPEVEPEPEPVDVQQERNLEQAYSDDNDGKKNDCHWGEACAIM